MAASDHLSRVQFMSMDQIGAMESQIPGMTVAQSYHAPERWDAYEQDMAKAKGYQSAEHYHAALTEHMRQHGQKNPIRYSGPADFLANGHHRVYSAMDLGWKGMTAEPYEKKPEPHVEGWDR